MLDHLQKYSSTSFYLVGDRAQVPSNSWDVARCYTAYLSDQHNSPMVRTVDNPLEIANRSGYGSETMTKTSPRQALSEQIKYNTHYASTSGYVIAHHPQPLVPEKDSKGALE